MLPYSPLHHLLLADAGVPLVMTSGNVSDEPIAFTRRGRAGAARRHRRRCSCSTTARSTRAPTTRCCAAGGVRAPLARLRARDARRCPPRRPLLAVGAELKSTFTLARDGRAWVGHHIGDLRNYETLRVLHRRDRALRAPVRGRARARRARPAPRVPVDQVRARARRREHVGVQHHHAHLAACLAEHGVDGAAVGAIYDGTGYGTDGTVWGGELLLGDLRGFERVGHLWPVRMPGGEAAIREPWRMACAWLAEAGLDTPPEWARACAALARDRPRLAGDDEHGPPVRRRRRAVRHPRARDLRGPGGGRARGRGGPAGASGVSAAGGARRARPRRAAHDRRRRRRPRPRRRRRARLRPLPQRGRRRRPRPPARDRAGRGPLRRRVPERAPARPHARGAPARARAHAAAPAVNDGGISYGQAAVAAC